MKILISAGETSGDQRGAEVLSALKRLSSDPVKAFGLGGNRLAAEGMDVTHDLTNYAVMGFGEILRSLGRFLKLQKELEILCLNEKPDCILLVDYPGFNMRFGRWAKKKGIPVIHYVAPQMWAWGAWRVRKLKRSTDLLLTLFAFEQPFFRERGVKAVFTGHPIKNVIVPLKEHGNALGLLPGSRAQEVRNLLPDMLKTFTLLRDKGITGRALLAVSDHLDRSMYDEAVSVHGVEMVSGTAKVLTGSKAALVCSGTATLETALYGVPFAVCYKTSSFTYFLAKHLVRGVDRIGLANIIAGETVAPELIQGEVTPLLMQNCIEPLFVDEILAEKSRKKLELVRNALGDGDSAENAAREILEFLDAQ